MKARRHAEKGGETHPYRSRKSADLGSSESWLILHQALPAGTALAATTHAAGAEKGWTRTATSERKGEAGETAGGGTHTHTQEHTA